MDFIRTEETINLNALLKALKSGNDAEIEKYRKLTGVGDDYETIKATVRFVEAGFVPTYADARKLRAAEAEQEKEIEKKLESAEWYKRHRERNMDMLANATVGRASWDLTDAERELARSEQNLRDAEEYRRLHK